MDGTGSEVVEVRHRDRRHETVTLVDWSLGNRCDYACSYCPPGLHDGSRGWQRADDVVALIERLSQHYGRLGQTVWIQFTGGEPTLHPHLRRFLEEARRTGCRTSVISNASRTERYWSAILPLLDSVILTYHPEEADADHVLGIAALADERIPVHVNVAMPPDRFEAALDVARRLAEAVPRASIALKPLRRDFGAVAYPYTSAQLDVLAKGLPRTGASDRATPRSGIELVAADGRIERPSNGRILLEGRNRWSGFLCNAGVESLRIRPDGTVARAVCGVGGTLGRLGDPFDLPVGPIVCDRKSCSCVADVLITKKARTTAAEPPRVEEGGVAG